jgi:hypothetical protein
MKNHLTLIGACALVAAAIFVSAPAGQFSSRADTAEAATMPQMSPTDMMINYDRPLSVEQWDLS